MTLPRPFRICRGPVRSPILAAGALALAVLASGCSADRPPRAGGDAATAPATAAAVVAPPVEPPVAGGTVDSIIPLAEALRRFRAGLAPVQALAGGAPSREALAARFVQALAKLDTAAVRAMVLDRAEFAYLYYPGSDLARPPRAQAPALAWFLMRQNSEKGITRALRRLGGQPLTLHALTCDGEPRRQGEIRVWSGCTVAVGTADGATADRQRLFGSIVERDGRFKFLSYANQF